MSIYRENLLTGEPLAECPLRTILRRAEDAPELSAEVNDVLEWSRDPRLRKHLLVRGGWKDQPARWLDLVKIVGRNDNATEAKDMELREKNTKQGEGKD